MYELCLKKIQLEQWRNFSKRRLGKGHVGEKSRICFRNGKFEIPLNIQVDFFLFSQEDF